MIIIYVIKILERLYELILWMNTGLWILCIESELYLNLPENSWIWSLKNQLIR